MTLRPARFLMVLSLAALAVVSACSATEDGTTTPTPDAGPADTGLDLTPTGIETMAPAMVRAGDAITVTCLLTTRDGTTVTPPEGMTPTVRYAPETAVRTEGGRTIAVRAGAVDVACALPSAGLADATPARVQIVAGPAARITTRLDRDAITAGERVTATCTVTDAYGNPVNGTTPTLGLMPMGEGAAVAGLSATITRAGMYTAACRLPGAMGDGAALTVRPALPAALRIARMPDRPVYAVGEDIDVERVVTDRYGNVVTDAMVPLTSTPEGGRMIRDGRYQYDREGRFTVTARVAGPTEGGVVLSQSTSFVVDSSGPAIRCTSPADASMVDAAPGSTVTLRGVLTDTTGVRSARVNGRDVAVAMDGTFSTTVTTRWGINFVDVSATDTDGRENSRTCAFLLSDEWHNPDDLMANAVGLRLTQRAVDDGDPTAPITSLGDILQTVVNSRGLSDQLHASLTAANPLKPSSCDQSVFGVCVLRSQVDYLASEVRGPNTTTLTLVNGGLRAQVRFNNLRVRLRISGTFNTTGWVDFQYLDVALTFDLAASGGRPRISVRPGSVTVSVGRISTDFSGLTGFIVDIVASLAQGRIRTLVSDMLRGYVQDNFSRVLDGVVGGLDVSSLGASFNVPRLDGAGTVPLRFGLGLSSLDATTSRARFGLGTRFTATPTRATASRGVALPPGGGAEPTLTTPATVTVQIALLNHALHTLWKAGFLDARISGMRFGGEMFADATATIAASLPPVASLRSDGRINLDLGALEASIVHPTLFPMGVRVTLGARASTVATLMGNDLRFGAVTVDELHINIESTSITMMEREALVSGMRLLLQNLVDRSLNDALPAIPIPGFAIPASLSAYGLPAGRELGITSPAFSVTGGQFVLRGGFGVR